MIHINPHKRSNLTNSKPSNKSKNNFNHKLSPYKKIKYGRKQKNTGSNTKYTHTVKQKSDSHYTHILFSKESIEQDIKNHAPGGERYGFMGRYFSICPMCLNQ